MWLHSISLSIHFSSSVSLCGMSTDSAWQHDYDTSSRRRRPIGKCSRREGSKILWLAERLRICTSGFWNSWPNLLLRHRSAKWTGALHFCGDGRRPRTIFSLLTSFCDHPALQRNLISWQLYPLLRLRFLDLWLPGPTFLTLAGFMIWEWSTR